MDIKIDLMAMGTRKKRERQEGLWYGGELPAAPGHPFYKRLNEVLDQDGFDGFCESHCASFYHDKLGRPSLAPGLYFRIMMIGFFEGLDSERGIAWRLADSLTLRQFLSIGLDEKTPDHVTISRTRRLIDGETHQRIFTWVLERLAQGGLIKGKTIGVDSTTLEANAAMKSIVRRDTGENYTAYLKRLAEVEGVDATDAAALRRMDRKRAKKTSNEDWISPSDAAAEITKLKDGRTALAYKAENAVDMETGAIVAVTTHGGASSDPATVKDTVIEAGLAVAGLIAEKTLEGKYEVHPGGVEEVVADKGYPALVKKPVERPASCSKSKLLGRHALIQRSPGYVTADQNTSWHTTVSTPNGTIISHVPELSQNHAVAPEPSIRLSRLSAKMRKHSIAASW
jgi:transposase